MSTPENNSLPPDLAKMVEAAAVEIIEDLFPSGFVGDEDNSAAGHKGEVELEIAAILLRHLQPLDEQLAGVRTELEEMEALDKQSQGHLRKAHEQWSKDLTELATLRAQLTAAQEELARAKRELSEMAEQKDAWFAKSYELQTELGNVKFDLSVAQQDLRTAREYEKDRHKFFCAALEAVGMKGEVGSLNVLERKIVEAVTALQSSAQKGAEDGKRLEGAPSAVRYQPQHKFDDGEFDGWVNLGEPTVSYTIAKQRVALYLDIHKDTKPEHVRYLRIRSSAEVVDIDTAIKEALIECERGAAERATSAAAKPEASS